MEANLFAKLIGQKEVAKKLSNLTEISRKNKSSKEYQSFAQSWIFIGPMGSGRSIAALVFAAALQCEAEIPGCGKCKQCRMVLEHTHPDVYFCSPSGLSISVAEVRDMITFAAKQPTVGDWQIVLIEDADRLTESAANALLKSIEEPAENTIFLLCSPSASPEDIPITIASRCQLVSLQLPPIAEVANFLEEADIPADKALWAATVSGGHIGRAKRLATDEKSTELRLLGIDLLLYVIKKDKFESATRLLSFVNEQKLANDSKDKTQLSRLHRDLLDLALLDLLSFLRDALLTSLGNSTLITNTDLVAQLNWFVNNYAPEKFVQAFAVVQNTRELLERSVKPIFALDALVGNLANIFPPKKVGLR